MEVKDVEIAVKVLECGKNWQILGVYFISSSTHQPWIMWDYSVYSI